MITIPSPQNKQWSQVNSGEVFGNVFRSKNIDFNEKGYLKLAKRANMLDSSGKMLNCFYFASANLYIVPTSTTVYSISADLNTVQSITASGGSNPTLSIYGDGIMFNNLAYFSSTSTLHKMDSALAFTSLSGSITFTSSKFHPLTLFESLNYLAVGDANTVKLYNTSDTLVQTLTIPQEYEVTWLVYRDQFLYIGTRNVQGREAKMFIWNGSGTAAQASYGFNAEWSFSGCEYDSSITSITSNGEIVYFTGGGFKQLTALPVYSTGYQWWKADVNPTEGKVQRRGMLASGKKLYIVLSGHLGEYPYNLVNQPSGLWCYDPDVGLYHKAGGNDNETTSTKTVSSVDDTTDEVTFSSSSTAVTGTPCLYNGGGLDLGVYYLIRVSSTVFKIARTMTDALNGTAIDLTSTTAGTMYMEPVIQYGVTGFQTLNTSDEQVGAIAKIKNYASTQWYAQEFLWGSTIYYDVTVGAPLGTTGLVTFGFGENRGDFITTKIFANGSQEDLWERVIVRAGNIYSSNDKVVVKYKVGNDEGMPFSSAQIQGTFARTPVTWTSSTTFTTNADSYTEWINADVGDEVSFIAGNWAGATAHITAISENSKVFTVTIDETYPFYASGDESNVSVDNWTKLGVMTTSDGGIKNLPINKTSKWIQFKLELRGKEIKIEDIQIVNRQDYKPSK